MTVEVRTLGPLEHILHLKALPMLRDLPPAELAQLAQHANERYFRRGAVLYRPGERVASFHVVVDGQVRVQGGEYGDAMVAAREPLGWLSLLARDDAGLAAEAVTDTTTLEIEAERLLDVFEDQFTILLHQIRDLGRRTLQLRSRIVPGTYLAPGEGRALDIDPSRELGLVERLLYIRGGALSHVNMDAMVTLARQAELVRFDAGATIWRRGDASGFICALIHGRVRCDVEQGAFFCGPGYPLGNLESLCGEARWYDAVAVTPVVAMRNETAAFFDLLEDHFDMAMGYVATQANGLIARLAEARQASEGA
jgi:CRP-like cAMP-binding protein